MCRSRDRRKYAAEDDLYTVKQMKCLIVILNALSSVM